MRFSVPESSSISRLNCSFGFELRIVLDHGEQAAERRRLLVGRLDRLFGRLGREQPRARVGDVLVHAFLVLRVALDRFDQVRNQVVPALQLVLDLRPLRLDRLFLRRRTCCTSSRSAPTARRDRQQRPPSRCYAQSILASSRPLGRSRLRAKSAIPRTRIILSSPARSRRLRRRCGRRQIRRSRRRIRRHRRRTAEPPPKPPPNGPTPLDQPLQPRRPQRRGTASPGPPPPLIG